MCAWREGRERGDEVRFEIMLRAKQPMKCYRGNLEWETGLARRWRVRHWLAKERRRLRECSGCLRVCDDGPSSWLVSH